MKQGLTEDAASLAALRAAIAARNEKVSKVAFSGVRAEKTPHFDEGQLRVMAETEKCLVPGVRFEKGTQRWVAQYTDQRKRKKFHFRVNKFMSKGMTKTDGSLAALRAAIDLRAEKAGLQNATPQHILRMIRVVPDGSAPDPPNPQNKDMLDLAQISS